MDCKFENIEDIFYKIMFSEHVDRWYISLLIIDRTTTKLFFRTNPIDTKR